MYYELFDSVFKDNENKICIFEIGAFYVVLNEQAVYLSPKGYVTNTKNIRFI